MARELRESVGGLINLDDGGLGCSGNHGYLHARLASEPGWSVILEDDAQPLNSFADDLTWCLEHAPQPIVSLYLGTGYPSNWQPRIDKALEADTSWIVAPKLLHAVGYAIAPQIKGDLAQWMAQKRRGPGMAPDDAVSIWANKYKYLVAYTNPSLVDHRDVPTVLLGRPGNFRKKGSQRARHAHNTSQRLTWTDSTVMMGR